MIFFNKKPGGKNGINSRCKECISLYTKQYALINVDKMRKKNKKYKQENKEKIKVKDKIYSQKNKEKIYARQKNWMDKNPEKMKIRGLKARAKRPVEIANLRLMYKFGITLDEYNAISASQGGVCAICKMPEGIFDKKANRFRSLAVDHDHGTGAVRGLLCGACNKALGLFRDNVEIINKACEYLKKERKQ